MYIQPQAPDRSDYTLQGEYDFKEQNAPSKVSFSEGIKATGIKFEVLSGLGDFVSCDEMEFYKTNTDKTLDKQIAYRLHRHHLYGNKRQCHR